MQQLQYVYRYVMGEDFRYRSLWTVEIPLSERLQPWPYETLTALDVCLSAMGAQSAYQPSAATEQVCDQWTGLADGDPLLALVTTAMGGYWPEPALRSALREALWQQPDLYNGDSRFCWSAGGPEGEGRRQLWQGIMALGPKPARVAREARTARHTWYDDLLRYRQVPVAVPTVVAWAKMQS
ncbi:MAG: hypothetical protein H7338_02115 [Candidatus Sericytochromatia bacterium]|nr:hypothetical protein [Candidatus Sericytochromatia bacterium]